MMITALKGIQWVDPVNIATAFCTIFMMGLAGSITDGIAFGVFSYIIGSFVMGRKNEISVAMWILGAVFLAYFIITFLVIPAM